MKWVNNRPENVISNPDTDLTFFVLLRANPFFDAVRGRVLRLAPRFDVVFWLQAVPIKYKIKIKFGRFKNMFDENKIILKK